MKHSYALAVHRTNPFVMAARSAKTAVLALVDFMYGTPDRTRLTCFFACALLLLGATMGDGTQHAVCPNTL